MRRFFLPLVSTLFVVACTSSPAVHPAVAPTTGSSASPTPLHAQIAPTDDDPGGSSSEVFERAKSAMADKKWAHARTLFDRVIAAEEAEQTTNGGRPSPILLAASYNAALSSEGVGDMKDARNRHKSLAMIAPESVDAVDANLRRARLDVEIEDYADLSDASTALLARQDLAPGDRAEALGYQAMVLVDKKDLLAAAKDVTTATNLLHPTEDATPPPQNLAAVSFAEGELHRAEANAIALNPPPPNFSAKLEERVGKIFDAQDAYVQTIRTGDATWAVRAGLRVSATYSELHDEIIAIPPPAAAKTDEKKALFRGAMHLRYRVLLEKGIGTLDRTLALETSTGVKTAWLDHVRDAKVRLEKELADEKAEMAKLPYTEAQLQKALDDLAKSSSKT